MNTIKNEKKFSSSDEFCIYMSMYWGLGGYEFELRMLIKKLAQVYLEKIQNKNMALILSDKQELEALRFKREDIIKVSPLLGKIIDSLQEREDYLLFKEKLYLAINEEISNEALKVKAGLFRIVNEDIFKGIEEEKEVPLKRVRYHSKR